MNAAHESTVRALLATGDQELEARLVAGLPAAGVVVVARALDATTLLRRVSETYTDPIDVALVSAGLHGLREETLLAIRERRVPVLLLAETEDEAERYTELVPALLASAPAEDVAAALRRIREGLPLARNGGGTPRAEDGAGRESSDSVVEGRIVAVTSGKGGPGATTVAISLAAELGRSGSSVVLVDADLRGGNVAPYLGLDPRHGLTGLLAGGPLDARLDAGLQAGPHCAALAGVERPEHAAAIPPEVVAGALARLRARYEHVVVDLGSLPDGAALAVADQVLLVSGADLVALWNARLALEAHAPDGDARWSVVVNRREGREHYAGDEIERALGTPVSGVVREDRRAARRAIEQQAPLSAVGGKAAADLRAIARAFAEAEPQGSDAVPGPTLERALVEVG